MRRNISACALVSAPAFTSPFPLKLVPQIGPLRQKTTVAACTITSDKVSTISPRLLHARILLHLLQLSRQQRYSGSTSEGQTHYPLASEDIKKNVRPLAIDKNIAPNGGNDEFQERFKCDGNAAKEKKDRDSYSVEERQKRSDRLRAKWLDPVWRENLLAKRRSKESTLQKSESLKKLWQDEEWRSKMVQSRLGRAAPNKGVSPSSATRLRMSVALKGRKLSDETRHRMSLAKINRPEGDEWRRLISNKMKGKTREFFAMRREYRALKRDLKLWSDSYRAKYGVRPRASTYERFVAPMMVLRIRRYLMLREALGSDNLDAETDIISQ